MSRIIKFRAWDNINKKWMLGYEYPNLGGFSMDGECMMFGEYQKALSSFRLQDLHEFKLMQFTGLTDKNGKEIYEWDILKGRHGCYEVGELNDFVIYAHESPNWFRDQEVIGDIYSNPDLIK